MTCRVVMTCWEELLCASWYHRGQRENSGRVLFAFLEEVMSSFFGITRLGPPNVFASSSKQHCEHCHQEPKRSIAQVPLCSFVEEFQKRAETENLSHQVRRVLVPEIIDKVLGRKLSSKENEVMVRHFDLELGHISLQEFEGCLQRFQYAQGEIDFAAQSKCKCSGSCEIPKRISNLEIAQQKVKHTRDKFGPMDVLQYPLTDSQRYGWEVETQIKPKNEYFPRKQKDVTKSEGICLDNYYT